MAEVTEIDALTGIVVERKFTAAELSQRQADEHAAEQAAQAEFAVKAARETARASAIARFKKLGFTDEELAELILHGGA